MKIHVHFSRRRFRRKWAAQTAAVEGDINRAVAEWRRILGTEADDRPEGEASE